MELSHSEQQAKAQYESISAMLGALGVDYDSLDELRERVENLTEDVKDKQDEIEHYGDIPSLRIKLEYLQAELSEAKAALAELEAQTNGCDSYDEAEQAICDDPLEIQVRSGWCDPYCPEMQAEEFYILLCTGGPAVRIMGELDENGTPSRAWMEHQDWGTPWTQYHGADQATLVAYSQRFFL